MTPAEIIEEARKGDQERIHELEAALVDLSDLVLITNEDDPNDEGIYIRREFEFIQALKKGRALVGDDG